MGLGLLATAVFGLLLVNSGSAEAAGIISNQLPNDGLRLVVAGPNFDFGGNVSRALVYSAPGSNSVTVTYSATTSNANEVNNIKLKNYNFASKSCGTSDFDSDFSVTSTTVLSANNSGTYLDPETNRRVFCLEVTAESWAGDSPFYLTVGGGQLVGNDVAFQATKQLGTGYIYDDTPSSSDPTWFKELYFGTPCAPTTYNLNRSVGLFDLDVGNNGAWTQGTITWYIQEVDPATNGIISTIPGFPRQITSTSGNNQSDTFSVTLQTNKKYRLSIWNLNGVNAIKIALPYSQLDYTKDCYAIYGDPIGYADSCWLSGTTTYIYGWGYDDNANGNNRPSVTTRLNGGNARTANTSRSGYRVSQINGFLDWINKGNNARDNVYGFRVAYTGLVRGNNYTLSGTVNNYGGGTSQPLGINTSTWAPAGGGGGPYGFPSNRIPDNCLPPRTTWNYYHQTFTVGPSSSASPTYPRVFPGTVMTANNRIRNNGSGPGRPYTQLIQRRIGNGSWGNIYNSGTNGLGGLNNGQSRNRSANYTLPTNLANDTVVCFRGAIIPYAGQSYPSLTTTSSGWRISGTRCVRVYNANPTASIDNINCNTLSYTVGDADAIGNSIRVELLVDGVVRRTVNRAPGSYSFNISGWRDLISHNFRIRAVDTTAGGDSTLSGTDSPGVCVNVTCTSISPASVGTGTPPFDVSFGFSLLPFAIGNEVGNKSYTGQLTFNGNTYPMYTDPANTNTTGTLNSASGTGPFTMYRNNVPTPIASGIYNITVTLNGLAANPINCNENLNVLDQPYTRFYGNDTISCDSVRGIFNTPAITHNDYVGSASELAIFASNNIEGFLPGSMDNTRSALQELAFANVSSEVNIASLDYGGGLTSCSRASGFSIPADIVQSTDSDVGRFGVGDHEYQYTGGNTPLIGNVGTGERVAIYVDGDVDINTINYQTLTWDDDDPADPDPAITADPSVNIPQVTIIATGDIYIRSNVVELDANLISTGGDVFTCAGSGSERYLLDNVATDRAYLATQCRNKLTINGSVFANRIHFLRSAGTLTTATPFEPYDSPNISEVIRFSPEVYLVEGGAVRPRPSSNPTIDSIISRPPSL